MVTGTVFRTRAPVMKGAGLRVRFYSPAETSPSDGKEKLIQDSANLLA